MEQPGRVFMGGKPPAVLRVRSVAKEFVKGGKVHYPVTVTFRRATRDTSSERFALIKAPTWGVAINFLLDRVLPAGWTRSRLLRAVGATLDAPFPTMFARVRYRLRVSGKGSIRGKPNRCPVGQRTIQESLPFGLQPGGYSLSISTSVDIDDHPLATILRSVNWGRRLFLGYRIVKAANPAGWIAYAIFAEVSIGRTVSEQLTTRPVYRFDVPARMPQLAGLAPSAALQALRARGLRGRLVKVPTSNRARLGPGGRSKVFRQGPAPGTMLRAGTAVRVDYYAFGRTPTDRIACTENWWTGTWARREHAGEAIFGQSGGRITSGRYTWFGGGSFAGLEFSDGCRTMTGTSPATDQLKAAVFKIHLDDKNHFSGHWRWASTPSTNASGTERWDGTFGGVRTGS